MMSTLRSFLLTFLCVGLAACASSPDAGPTKAQVARANAVTIQEGDVIDIGALPSQELPPGECGLFLFAAKPTKRFVFFATASGGTGEMKLNGEIVTFVRTNGQGRVIDQHFTEQTYASPALGLELTVSIDLVSTALAGTRVDGGSLRLTRQDGWSMVVPVGGATTCGSI